MSREMKMLRSPHSKKTIECHEMSYAFCKGLERGWYVVNEAGRRLPCFFIHHAESDTCITVHKLSEAEEYAWSGPCDIVLKETYIKFCKEYKYGN